MCTPLEVLEARASEPRAYPVMLGRAATSRRDKDLTPFGRQEAGLELRVPGAAALKGVGRVFEADSDQGQS